MALDLAASDGAVFAVRGVSRGRTIELSEVPRHLIDAVVTMEDRRFFHHSGFDLRGVLRAAFANLMAGDAVQGGSTITQQLAKNLFLSPERTLARKIQEVLLAIWLERRLTKGEYIADREVACRPTADDRYRCEVDGWDLSGVVLFNGGGRVTADAAPELVEAERKARREGRGIWSR